MRKREAVLLQAAAVDSIVLAVDHFNRAVGPARMEASVIFAQRGLELLLKAAIYEQTGTIRERGATHTHSFRKCINIGVDQLNILGEDERISLHALEGDRDAAIHHLIQAEEPILYIKIQSAVTIFASLLESVFGEQLTDHLPRRALPVSAQPPATMTEALDAELTAIRALLAPRKRQSVQAKARIRTLLNLEAAAWARTEPPSEKELERALKALREGRDWRRVFPGVATLEIQGGPGERDLPVSVRLTKSEGPPVRRAQPDEAGEALLYREYNPFDRWPFKPTEVSRRVGLTTWRTWALIEDLGLKADEEYFKEITVGDQVFPRYSQKAVDRLLAAKEEEDMDAIWDEYRRTHRIGRR